MYSFRNPNSIITGTISNAQRYKINPELELLFLNNEVFILKILPEMIRMRTKQDKTSSKKSGKLKKWTINANIRMTKPPTEKLITTKQFHLSGLRFIVCDLYSQLFTIV